MQLSTATMIRTMRVPSETVSCTVAPAAWDDSPVTIRSEYFVNEVHTQLLWDTLINPDLPVYIRDGENYITATFFASDLDKIVSAIEAVAGETLFDDIPAWAEALTRDPREASIEYKVLFRKEI